MGGGGGAFLPRERVRVNLNVSGLHNLKQRVSRDNRGHCVCAPVSWGCNYTRVSVEKSKNVNRDLYMASEKNNAERGRQQNVDPSRRRPPVPNPGARLDALSSGDKVKWRQIINLRLCAAGRWTRRGIETKPALHAVTLLGTVLNTRLQLGKHLYSASTSPTGMGANHGPGPVCGSLCFLIRANSEFQKASENPATFHPFVPSFQ